MSNFKNWVCECKMCGKRVNSIGMNSVNKPSGNPHYSTNDKCVASPSGKHAWIWAEK